MGVARTIVVIVAAVAIVALLLTATGVKGRLRESGSTPVVLAILA
jgi:hypothetical protein